ncbi:MAG: ABC transporter ATP-binding protein [Flavobacteriales bacterium]|nr:ABC transporter ATP-binding protein [Flavobacteriales bacterium]MCB9165609.1 ABC transporter ATP-binding protein [Flavobacteriales bacterium]HPF90944.1 ABC transporter ATP-binding protein [Flavobacteriales bacterium]
MEGEVLIKVDHVSKKFCRDLRTSLRYGLSDLGREVLGRQRNATLRKDEFWALRDVSFELRRGECLGLVGHNGAGKTTMLRMLNGLIKPDAGRIELRGRVGALIALGAGFNPVLTGRENIQVNASVLGLSKERIKEKFDEIVAFAEVGEFIDMPLQSYSSGMAARLGFSVAIAVEPDILLVDEVLAVGDHAFRLKAQRAMRQAMAQGTSVVVVSHNLHDISGNTTRCLWLEKGTVRMDGDTSAVSSEYMHAQTRRAAATDRAMFDYSPNRKGHVVLNTVSGPVAHGAGRELVIQDLSVPIDLDLDYVAVNTVNDEVVHAVNLVTTDGSYIARGAIKGRLDARAGEPFRIRLRITPPDLLPGRYHIEHFTWMPGGDMLEGVTDLVELEVLPAASLERLRGSGTLFFTEKMTDNAKGSVPLTIHFEQTARLS